MESRIALLVSASRHLIWRVRHFFHTTTPEPEPFHWNYSGRSVFFIGILHGIGAETPSQLMLFLLAASLGGTGLGLLGLLAFGIGLILMNGIMTATLGGIYKSAAAGDPHHQPAVFRWVALAGAVYSLVIGVIFLLGASDILPPLG